MNYLMDALSLIGILSTAVIYGTDMFFLTVGRPALRRATAEAGTEVMGFFHQYADVRMPIWGISAIVSNLLLIVFTSAEHRWLYAGSFLALCVFTLIYNRRSKPINRIQTEAANNGSTLNSARDLQASWDRSLTLRLPLLAISLFSQCVVLLSA